jgi:hypothetical protein
LNNCDVKELIESLNELDRVIVNIENREKANIDEVIDKVLQGKDAYFLVWFCFLRANFLRGGNVISNKAFMKFVENSKKENFYFEGFPNGDILPYLGWYFAGSVENVLKQVREKYRSGKEFAKTIRIIAENEEDPFLCYQKLIEMLTELDGVGRKIANAFLDQVGNRVSELEEQQYENLLKENWFKKLFLTSFFNVMIDSHIENFFREKFNIKDVNQHIFIEIAKKVKKDVILSLFEEWFSWIDVKDKKLLLEKYFEFVGANIIEKIIWMAGYVKKNLKEKESLTKLKFFKITGNLFL